MMVLVMSVCATLAWGQTSHPKRYTFTTIAGTAGLSGSANGINGNARFASPQGITVDLQGNLFVADYANHTIREVSPVGTDWVVTTIAGTAGIPGNANGFNSTARFNEPVSIAADVQGNLYVADYGNNTIRKLTPSGPNWAVTTIAGLAGNAGSTDGTNGSARFSDPSGITVDASGNLYVADTYNRTIRKLAPVGTDWVVTTIAGTAQTYGSSDGANSAAQFQAPAGITVDSLGNLYVADTLNSTIRKLTPDGTNWVVTTLAGQPENFGSTDGTNLDTQFNYPYGITVDANGNLYVADSFNYTIRKVAPEGANWVVSTLGGAALSPGAKDGLAANARFSSMVGIAVDTSTNLYVGDTENRTIRKGYFAPTPPLTIVLADPNTVVVSWPDVAIYTVQTNSDLMTTNWDSYGGTVTTSNGTNSVTVSPPTGNLFFRLLE